MNFRTARIIINSVLVAEVVVVLPLVLYMMFYPFKTLTVKQPDKILNPGKQVQAGGVLVYQIDYCKYTNKQAEVTRALIGKSVTYALPVSTNNVPQGCTTAVSRNTVLPVGTQPGTYKLELTATYRINFLRDISVRHSSESFTVVP
jgi:hypothetical protein